MLELLKSPIICRVNIFIALDRLLRKRFVEHYLQLLDWRIERPPGAGHVHLHTSIKEGVKRMSHLGSRKPGRLTPLSPGAANAINSFFHCQPPTDYLSLRVYYIDTIYVYILRWLMRRFLAPFRVIAFTGHSYQSSRINPVRLSTTISMRVSSLSPPVPADDATCREMRWHPRLQLWNFFDYRANSGVNP